MNSKTIYGFSPKVLDSIIQTGINHNVDKIILFGSRARGDFKERSDIDIAVSGGNVTRFTLDVDEFVPTLLFFDVVNLDQPVQSELLDSIKSEGVLIYEKV